jgi:hypothetical protein
VEVIVELDVEEEKRENEGLKKDLRFLRGEAWVGRSVLAEKYLLPGRKLPGA